MVKLIEIMVKLVRSIYGYLKYGMAFYELGIYGIVYEFVYAYHHIFDEFKLCCNAK